MWYVATILYLIISAFALRLQVEKRDDYFDIRNIFVALLWFIMLPLAFFASFIDTDATDEENKGRINK